MLSYRIRETNYLHLLWPDPSNAPRVKRIYNLPRNRAEFGVDHSFLWKNLQTDRGGRKSVPLICWARGESRGLSQDGSAAQVPRWEQDQVQDQHQERNWGRSGCLPALCDACPPAVMPAHHLGLRCLGSGHSVEDPALQRAWVRRWPSSPFCREIITCPRSLPTTAFCIYKSMGRGFSHPVLETYSCIQSLILCSASDSSATFMPDKKNKNKNKNHLFVSTTIQMTNKQTTPESILLLMLAISLDVVTYCATWTFFFYVITWNCLSTSEMSLFLDYSYRRMSRDKHMES